MKNGFTLTGLFFVSFLLISGTIDLNDLFDYSGQDVPEYISKDNTPPFNLISDEVATLGRVLFYDKMLSANNTIACASCHKQEFAFGDTSTLSLGLDGGLTGRHSMRLINARFANENRFFWDERANSLETQTTMPIQDHVEMGFSGANGAPGLDSLIRKLEAVDYYEELFTFLYGDPVITENRMQRALAQFIRSIQSFDSKFDVGLAQANNMNAPFPNLTPQENMGKNLFLTPPANGGAGCQACHRAPEFDIVPNSQNNGVIAVAGNPGMLDLTNTRSPSLREIINPEGFLNGPLMHNGAFTNLLQVINHYDSIPFNPVNTNLDPRLTGPPGGPGNPPLGQNLQLNQNQKQALVAFLGTLTGEAVYTDERWSNPFDSIGELTLISYCGNGITTSIEVEICDGETFEGYAVPGTYTNVFTSVEGCDSTRILNLSVLEPSHQDCISTNVEEEYIELEFKVAPNPFKEYFNVACECRIQGQISLFDLSGRKIMDAQIELNHNNQQINTSQLSPGIYIAIGFDENGVRIFSEKLIKVE